MRMPTTHPFLKPFCSLKKAITRSRSPMALSADITTNDLARPSSDLPILTTPSSTIRAAEIAIPAISNIPFNLSAPNSDLPTPPPIAPVPNVGLVSVDTETTFPFDQFEGSVQGAVDFLQHPSSVLTDSPSSNLPTSLPIPSVLNAEAMPTDSPTNFQPNTIHNISAQNVNTAPNFGVDPNIQITLETLKDEQLVDKIYKWLSPPKESINYNAAYAILKSQPDASQWFLKGNTFSEWLKQPGFLWIKGKSGSGKTVLSSAIIHDLLQRFNSATAYFFFDGRDSQKDFQLHHKLIRSLIWQFSLK
ncbi:hypothetical protein K443DRAFT_679455, partial [Laccaria amethystina LaAM-08-1]